MASLQSSEIKNNLQWIESNLAQVFDSLQFDSRITKAAAANINFGAVKGEYKGFLKNNLINWLEKNTNSDPGPGKKLSVEQFNIQIVYEQNSSGFLGLGTTYYRRNQIVLQGWIAEESGAEIDAIQFKRDFVQKLETDDFTELEESPYSFTRGKTLELSMWTKTIEPVMALSAVAVIVYLFFSVRS